MKNEDSTIKALGAIRYNLALEPNEYQQLKAAFQGGSTHVNLELSFNYEAHQTMESKDTAFCMYDYAKEILELMKNFGQPEKNPEETEE